MKEEPKVNYIFSLSEEDELNILRAVEVSSSKFISFTKNKSNLFLCIGDSNSGEHVVRIKIEGVETVKECIVEKITFNKDYFVNILKLNSELTLKLMDGLLIYEYKSKDINASYYQRSIVGEDN